MTISNRLTVLAIKSLKEGFHADGQGLYLRVSGDKKNWSFLFQWEGRRSEMGLGALKDVSLSDARIEAAKARSSVRAGVNPIVQRRGASSGRTFRDVSAEFIELKGSGWRNPKHRQQWTNTLRDYAKPIMDMPVEKITTVDVLACLKTIWTTKPETASRVRMRIENVLDAAKAQGYRTGENPAAWKGNLAHLLPPPSKLTRGHQRALDFRKAPTFMKVLRRRAGVAAKALEFTVLNAVRTSETLGAVWPEIDWEACVWNVPGTRTKTAKLLRVALSDDAISILRQMRELDSDWIFPNAGRDGPLCVNAMSSVLKRMGMDAEATVHGFRSTFSDWAGETTDFPRDIVEMALGHRIGNAVERAYRRGDALDRRRALMDAWQRHLR